MRKYSIHKLLFMGALLFVTASCEKYYEPTTSIDEESALTNAGDVETATIGTYAVLLNAAYVRSVHFLMEYPSDEIAQGQSSGDDLTRAYRYTHINTSGHATNFWGQAYKVIAAANKIIAYVPDESSVILRQLKGENLYLRAMMHFNLVRVFGRPYTQESGNNPGVPLLMDGMSDDAINNITRSSVKEVYDSVIQDLIKAADLMSEDKSNSFASKEVAQALLARVYLYKGENENAIKYADLVIKSGRYKLVQGGEFSSYFKTAPASNQETIFAIRHTKVQDRGFSAIGSMYFSANASGIAEGQGVSGWAEIYASKKYVDFLAKNPADLRSNFISPYTINGVLQYNMKLTPSTPMYYINKYSMQEGVINLSSPVYLRLAEMHLIRAEANAKTGKTAAALEDVNLLRQRAGLSGNQLYTIGNLGTKKALDVVMEERWLELAFEGHRSYDLFRNNLPMERNYPGTHSLNNTPTTNITQKVLPTDARTIFFIPQAEIDRNPKLTQNP
ncbi:RagB/SusD family nutrient uptake outer membrane protein [Dyadobacter fanqingshengii]|uniref:RagB/SusD family nutrient uptake outer membrane protein n=1 Tax=Dyadobacter fanqingshengii TaxID=2906443 RepID=A0A9X1P9R8_9BACT|nr:RagB/SusD family nutrient uptake outer membrane protein [Dyadobacter fanqingshengii]MCF0041326.1 RagB/SusD family nutrient uptake outer membrane protein [Dyadobacter fanqingshengii]USJ36951.1 RagB/SusD family nutrient uptake outer membrane protein [Dyadobacter fanqingshengii]